MHYQRNTPENLLHQKFNRLTAIKFAGRDKCGRIQWLWLCDCGISKVLLAGNVKSGHTQSCGCWHREQTSKSKKTHGATVNRIVSVEYTTWVSMGQRCTNPKDAKYKRYGGRGITVCERWQHSFENFYADMGDKPKGLTLERKDTDGHYTPDNCKWAPTAEQNRNYSRNVMLTLHGKTMCMADWSSHTGISAFVIRKRNRAGVSDALALTAPVGTPLARLIAQSRQLDCV